MANLFDGIPESLPEEHIESLAEGEGARILRIVSRQHSSPPDFWYDQDVAEWVSVLQGSARLLFDDGEMVDLGPGDWIDIPAHRKHRVEHTDPERDTVWLVVFRR